MNKAYVVEADGVWKKTTELSLLAIICGRRSGYQCTKHKSNKLHHFLLVVNTFEDIVGFRYLTQFIVLCHLNVKKI